MKLKTNKTSTKWRGPNLRIKRKGTKVETSTTMQEGQVVIFKWGERKEGKKRPTGDKPDHHRKHASH
jgi:hypothetical protein